jgi:hypothetical protein
MRTCLNCYNCKVHCDLVPLSAKGGKRKFRHPNAVAEEILNSKIVRRNVRCSQNMWTTHDGKEFIYKRFASMMNSATHYADPT